MLEFLSANLGTVIVGAVLVAILAAVVLKMRKDKKNGASCSCGCGCSGCPSAGMCPSGAEKKEDK